MKNLIILLIAFSLTSCLTVKRIEKNCDKFATVCITDSKTVIEYRDTTIYVDRIVQVKLPADTVTIVKTLYIDNDKCFLDYTYKKFGNIWASAKVDNSILDLKAGYVNNIVQVPIHDTIFINDAISNSTTDNTVVLPPEKYVSKFSKFTHWWFFICIFAIGIFITWKIKGAWIKGVLGNLK